MGFLVEDVKIGHWTDIGNKTGCTVLHFPEGSIASGEVRGGSPATREFDLLAPERTVKRIDAVVMTGGSAFGLAAADGVVGHLAEAGIGYQTTLGPVPIVVAMALYDLQEGNEKFFPGPNEGRAASVSCGDVGDKGVVTGRVGAGTGATVGTWWEKGYEKFGGLGLETACKDGISVSALFAVNAAGSLNNEITSRSIVDGTFDMWPEFDTSPIEKRTNTTLGVVFTNARLTKLECFLVAQSSHDGIARALFPAHTRFDGDAVVVVSTGTKDFEGEVVDLVRVLATAVTEAAIQNAC